MKSWAGNHCWMVICMCPEASPSLLEACLFYWLSSWIWASKLPSAYLSCLIRKMRIVLRLKRVNPYKDFEQHRAHHQVLNEYNYSLSSTLLCVHCQMPVSFTRHYSYIHPSIHLFNQHFWVLTTCLALGWVPMAQKNEDMDLVLSKFTR